MTKVICFDLRCLQIGHESRGIGMHARSILENIDPRHDFHYIIYAYKENDPIRALSIDMPVPYTLVQTETLSKSIDKLSDFFHLARVIFHRFTALKGYDIDFFVQFDFMLGLPKRSKSKKNILVAYDLIPLIFKDDYIPTPYFSFKNNRGVLRKIKGVIRAFYYQLRYALHYKNFRKADLLLSISNSTTRSLVEKLNIPEYKIITIALAPVFNSVHSTRPAELAVTKPFIFYIGATDARKRVSDLIKAFDIVRESHDIALVLAGKEFVDRKKIPSETILKTLASATHGSDIHTLGYVNDSEKLWLYKKAELFVFPTAYEGFGLPVVEAMQNGCPVVSYDNSSIPEVSGDAVQLVPTGDIRKLAKAILCVLDNTQVRDSMIKLGYKRSQVYTWNNYMKRFYSALEDLHETR